MNTLLDQGIAAFSWIKQLPEQTPGCIRMTRLQHRGCPGAFGLECVGITIDNAVRVIYPLPQRH